MFNQSKLLEIISKKRNGILPSLVRGCLGCLTPIYRTAIAIRNQKFDRAIQSQDESVVSRAPVPVISVGNLTTGGTGKTPLVIWIAQWIRKQDIRVALLSRGYGSQDGPNDEAREIEQRLLDVPHLQDPDRFKMASIATEEFESQVLVLDDAFQHRQLHRDLDIVLIDATCPFGYGRLLPRGLLREPISSLYRADVVVITRSNLVSADEKEVILARVRAQIKHDNVVESQTTMTKLIQGNGKEFELSEIKGKPIFLFSAIGNPSSFKTSVEKNDFCNVLGTQLFPDHHEFSRDDITSIGKEAAACGAQAIVCTHKDLVKIGINSMEGLPVYAVLIEIEFTSGLEKLEKAIGTVCEGIARVQTRSASE